MDCFIAINKPYRWTSHDVVDYVRNVAKIKKVGHAGTLDPLATGVLIIAIGRGATKRIDAFAQLTKQYESTFDLKAFSETDDAQGPLYPVNIRHIPTRDDIEDTLQTFVGEQEQVPPTYSAVKVYGVPRYKAARSGEQNIDLPTRNIIIYSIRLLNYQWPYVEVAISCSTGTYIRSIARDLGQKLNTGGYVYNLQRTAVGPYTLEDAYDITQLTKITHDMCLHI